MTPDRPNISDPSTSPVCAKKSAEALHRYLDGDLSFVQQPELFEHLASCKTCRRTMDSVLAFRRMSRQEYIALPPAADEVFFERLARLKLLTNQVDRREDRKPLWNVKRSISLRSALALAGVVFLVGLLVPMPARTEYATALIHLEVERVQFEPSNSMIIESPIYNWVEWVTVESDRTDQDQSDQTR